VALYLIGLSDDGEESFLPGKYGGGYGGVAEVIVVLVLSLTELLLSKLWVRMIP
jgi:hypothetical protein